MNPLAFDFMRKALLAASLVGLAAPSIGVFLVQRRLALMGDGIGHVALLGVAGGLLVGVSPVVTALVVASLGAITIELLRERGRTAGDVALAIVFYGGIAGGALLTYLSGAPNALLGYLFGSIVLVNDVEVAVIALLAAGVLALTFGLRKELFALAYDEEVARASGVPVRRLNLLIALIAAVTIGVAMRVVGILLVSALLVVPVAAVQQVARSFRTTFVGSILLGLAVSVVGLTIAFYLDVAPGATIVLCAIGVFVVLSTYRALSGRAQ